MIKKSTLPSGIVLAVLFFSSQAASEANEPGAEPPEHLDGKGFFVLPQEKVRQLYIKSIKTSDWLYEEDGTTSDRGRGCYAEFDASGRITRFAGHVDQTGDLEREWVYDDDDRIVEERGFVTRGDERRLILKAVYDYSTPGMKERVIFDAEDAIQDNTRYLLDHAGRMVKVERLDVTSGQMLVTVEREYDEYGNFVEEYGPEGRAAHSFEEDVLTVSNYVGPRKRKSIGQLRSVEEYAFDDDGNLQSFYRESADGSFWDRFTYKLDERGLPVEQVWSRFEYVLQEPYELTKYSYEFHDRVPSGWEWDAASLREAEEYCGEPIVSVESFVFRHGDHEYVLPRNVEIHRSGERIHADPEPQPWHTPLAGISYASSGPDLLIRTFDRDCVDFYEARLFVIAPDGSVVQQPVWTSHWRDGFFEDEGQLKYWSEWFCRKDNPERGSDGTYVYAYSRDDRSFTRVPADASKMCAEDVNIPFIEFRPARAVSSPGKD